MTSELKQNEDLLGKILKVTEELGTLTEITTKSTKTIESLSQELAKANKMNDTNSKGKYS